MSKVVLGTISTALVVGILLTRPAGADDKPRLDVPYVPTKQVVVEAMLKLANVKEGDVVYDLGCGDGRIVITAVEKFKAKRGVGIDLDPERIKDCQANLKKALDEKRLTPEQAKSLTFKQGDVLKIQPEDLKEVDVVTLYLLPDINRKLKPVLQKGLKDGARVVSHDFDMGDDWKEDKKVEVMSDRPYTHTIYLWTIKKK